MSLSPAATIVLTRAAERGTIASNSTASCPLAAATK